MRIAVMGAGAVGCYFGGMLARSGHSVILIGRARHVEAIRRDGLLLETATFREYVRIDASTETAELRDAAVILYCVKSGDTEGAAVDMRPYLSDAARVLSLQNGIDNAARLQAALQREVWPAVVYVAAEMADAGHVRHHGRGELVIGADALAADMRQVFVDAGIPVQISSNVIGELWSKLILNCAFNALSAIARQPYGMLFATTHAKTLMRLVVEECSAVAARDGVVLPADSWPGVERIAATMPGQYSSTAQDLMRGHPGEIDHLNGYVVRRGVTLKVATPVNLALFSLVKILEGGEQK